MDNRKSQSLSMRQMLHTMLQKQSWSRQTSVNNAIVLGSEGFCGYDAKPGLMKRE
jgi:hypothetical protein